MVTFTDKFMKVFGNLIYDIYVDKFKQPKIKNWYVRPGKWEDLRFFCWRQIISKNTVTSKTLYEKSFEFTGTFDKIAVDILRFVKHRTIYTTDKASWNTPEYWQDASFTYQKREGDCEDGAILILTLARLAGIPSKRIFLRCGDVRSGGHAYVIYTASNGGKYIMDWCYRYNGRELQHRKEAEFNKNYLTRWFDVNDRYILTGEKDDN